MRGFTPHPDLGSFFGKKLPKNPKKPDCIGFRLSSIDSKQGCRRQPCFCLAQNVLTVYLRNLETKNPQFKIYTAKQNKVSSSFELASVIYRSGVLYFASKTSIVSISYAEVNSSNLSGLEHSLCLSAHGHHQEKERDSQERGKEPVFSFRGQ